MFNAAKNFAVAMARSAGLDIRRASRGPGETLLGLRGLPIGTVLDVGANRGQFARDARRWFPTAVIHCFEPAEQPFAALASWANAEGSGCIHAHQVALGDHEGETDLQVHTNHTPSSSLLQATPTHDELCPSAIAQHTQRVRMSALDAVVSGLQLVPDVLLKMDVQGFEDRVLAGAAATLQDVRAVITEVCIAPLYTGQARFSDITRLLSDSGLTYVGNLEQHYASDGRVLFLDAVFLRGGTPS
ncbi:MAG: FkbM family methyltransferase [Gammaproteobacteria bacterium]|jgi:FkbM family methyltransferase|nr:FkbM family methyltransferase [Gammaproteobacteria bacterium]